MSRHDTLSSPCILAHEKVPMCWQHDRHDARDSHDTYLCVGAAWTGVDTSTSLFPEVVPEIDANPEHKRLNLYTRALLLLCRLPCWNKHGSTRTTRHATTLCVSWRNKCNLVVTYLWFVLSWRAGSIQKGKNERKTRFRGRTVESWCSSRSRWWSPVADRENTEQLQRHRKCVFPAEPRTLCNTVPTNTLNTCFSKRSVSGSINQNIL